MEGSNIIPVEEIKEQIQKHLDEQVSIVSIALDANVQSYCEEGYPASTILKVAKEKKVELIITVYLCTIQPCRNHEIKTPWH